MDNISHKHDDNDIIDIDLDEQFTIDTATRAISSVSNKKITLMQYDHKSERYGFEIDRYVEGHDIMNCNRVQIHYINIGSSRNKNEDVYPVTDINLKPNDDSKVVFTWLVSQNATMYSGTLNFLISFECVDEECPEFDTCRHDEHILYRWSTLIYKSVFVNEGMNNNNTIYELYSDELLAWEIKMQTEFIPDIVDEHYINREFATSEEVAAVFDISNPDGTTNAVLLEYEEVTNEDVDNLFIS